MSGRLCALLNMDCGSLLAVECFKMIATPKSYRQCAAMGVLRPPRDSGGSRAASEKRQQAAAVHVVFA